MKYMLLIYQEEHALSEAEREECYVESAQLAREGLSLACGPSFHGPACLHRRPGVPAG